MADNKLLSSGELSVGDAAGSNRSINLLKNEGKNVTVAHNQANSSLKDLHDWFKAHAHITESDATGTGQSDIKFSEFYKAQILECTFYGYPESSSYYGNANNGYTYFVADADSLVLDGPGGTTGDYICNYSTGLNYSWSSLVNSNAATLQSGLNGGAWHNIYVRDGNTGAYIGQQVYSGYGGGANSYDRQAVDASLGKGQQDV